MKQALLAATALFVAWSAAGTLTSSPVRFISIAKAAGLDFQHHTGAFGKKYLPETMGAGCAFVDLDGDGYPDIILLNGKNWKPSGKRYLPGYFHNNRNGTFTSVIHGSGLDVEMYAMGIAVADYDNDGRPDVYITALEGDHLFHNEGGGKFRDVTAQSGIRNAAFGTGAAWLDYDNDGRADLFVANYIQWTPATDLWCSLDGRTKAYCTPESSKGSPNKLYRNLGNGKFEDVTRKTGLYDTTTKSLSVAVLDYNSDGWPDLFVSNDTQPNKLYRNRQNGTFVEEGVSAGVAFGEDGTARGAMGVDATDYDRSGRPSLLVGNFSNQMLGLYHNEGNGLFVDEAPASNVGRASALSLTFGAFFFDYDLDGYPDILAANGHTEVEIGHVQPKVQYREPPLLFRNLGNRHFENASGHVGSDFAVPLLARGAAHADFDRDGDLDILITNNGGSPVLLRNDGGNQNHWLNVRLIGTKTNRSALGATVRVESSSGRQWDMVRSGGSYCSQSDLALTFGLGKDSTVSKLNIEWPSGTKQSFSNVGANQFLTIEETRGLIR